MNSKLRHILLLCVCLPTLLLSFSSCDDDYWFDDDWWEDGGYNDDRRAEIALRGRWYVDYVEIAHGDCPYYEGDEFNFYSNGRMEVFGDGDFYEKGRWFVEDRYLCIDFNRDGYVDMSCFIDDLYRNFVSLDVDDYGKPKSRYYLELGR